MSDGAHALTGVVVTMATDGARLALTLGAARAWDGSHGETLAPLAFPSAPASPSDGVELALAAGVRALGCPLEPAPTPWTYGPSPRHAMDRMKAAAGAPFLAYDRFDAPEEPTDMPRRVAVKVYHARVAGPSRGGECSVVWAPLAAVRAALGGVWLAALLAMDGVTLTPAAGSPWGMDRDATLVYLPAITGERQLLRACAKYGDTVVVPALPIDQ